MSGATGNPIAALGLLCWLGSWQYERAAQKAADIDAFHARSDMPVQDVESAFCGSDASADGLPVHIEGVVSTQSVQIYGFSTSGDAGWFTLGAVAAPSCLKDQGAILAPTQFTAFQGGKVEAIGRLRVEPFTSGKHMFTSPNMPDQDQWYWRDLPALRDALFLDKSAKLSDQWMLVADDGLPDHLRRVPPSRHIGYSVTWFGLAIALLVMYVAFHVHAGRLRFGDGDGKND